MRTCRICAWVTVLSALTGVVAGAAEWRARQLGTLKGFRNPESVLVVGSAVYVSNVQTDRENYWDKDGEGFISLLGGSPPAVRTLRWAASDRSATLNAPKGMCVYKNDLFVADIDTVWRFDSSGKLVKGIRVREARRLNDMATDGEDVYVSDTGRDRIYKLDLDGSSHKTFARLDSVNGITFASGRMYAVSWGKHDIYEIPDVSSRRSDPEPFGLAGKFKSLDGIEVLPDGTILVSDLEGGRIYAVSPDHKTVNSIAKVKGPADIGVDRQTGTLYVPMLSSDAVAVYRLEQR